MQDSRNYTDDVFLGTQNKFICPICLFSQYEPKYACSQEHYFCKGCLQEVLNNSKDNAKCPVCKERIFGKEFKCNRHYQQFYEEQRVQCQHKECGFQGELNMLQKHLLQDCDYAIKECKYKEFGCNEINQKLNLMSHIEQCIYQPIPCPNVRQGCQTRITKLQTLEEHVSNCEFEPIDCPNNCGIKQTFRKIIQQHCGEQCKLQIVHCQYCDLQIKRDDLEEHDKKAWASHAKVLIKYKKKSKEQSKQLKEMANQMRAMQQQMSNQNVVQPRVELQLAINPNQVVNVGLQAGRTQLPQSIAFDPNQTVRVRQFFETQREMKFELLFRASSDGWTNEAFIARCTDNGPTLILCKGNNNEFIGGYADVSWRNIHDEPQVSYECPNRAGFLFNLNTNKKFNKNIEERFAYRSYGGIYQFATCEFFESMRCNLSGKILSSSGLRAYTNVDYANIRSQIEQSKIIMGQQFVHLVELEVFQVTYA